MSYEARGRRSSDSRPSAGRPRADAIPATGPRLVHPIERGYSGGSAGAPGFSREVFPGAPLPCLCPACSLARLIAQLIDFSGLTCTYCLKPVTSETNEWYNEARAERARHTTSDFSSLTDD